MDYPWPQEQDDINPVYQKFVSICAIINSTFLGLTTRQMTPSGAGLCFEDKMKKRAIPPIDENQASGKHIAVLQSDSAVNEGQSDPDQIPSELAKRANSVFPGWLYPALIPVTASLLLKGNFGRGAGILESQKAKLKCNGCLTCELFDDDDDNDREECCGCVSMDLVHGDSDRPPCDTCNEPGGTWPGSGLDARAILISESSGYEDVGTFGGDDREGSGEFHQLVKRPAGIATLGPKKLRMCGRSYLTTGGGKYPSFPVNALWPWENIENGRWNAISRYWGNDSSVCSDWSVSKSGRADITNTPSGPRRSKYQSRLFLHVELC